jgi:hypothetical protein
MEPAYGYIYSLRSLISSPNDNNKGIEGVYFYESAYGYILDVTVGTVNREEWFLFFSI